MVTRRLILALVLLLAAPAVARAADGSAAPTAAAAPQALPRLVDLGAGKCIPCKKMAPIIEALRKDYAGIVDVVFVDVWKDPDAGKPYGIRLIPTQVFFDRAGKEVFRHEGFFSREQIEAVFREKLGIASPAAAGSGGDEAKAAGESAKAGGGS